MKGIINEQRLVKLSSLKVGDYFYEPKNKYTLTTANIYQKLVNSKFLHFNACDIIESKTFNQDDYIIKLKPIRIDKNEIIFKEIINEM